MVRVGARVEFICAPGPLKNGTEAAAAHQHAVEAVLRRHPFGADDAVPGFDLLGIVLCRSFARCHVLSPFWATAWWAKGERARSIGGDGLVAFGQQAQPLLDIRDLSIAGYNATLNKAATASPTTSYASAAEKNTRLVRAFPSPEDMAKFATEVLGDKRIYTCTQGTEGCPNPTNVTTATGLGPKYEAEYDIVLPKLQSLANISTGSSSSAVYGELQTISAPGMSVSPQLLDSLRRLPTDTRSIAVNRLSQELASKRTVIPPLRAAA